jgi:hypothetical protein
MKKLIVTSVFGLALAIGLGFGFIPSMDQSASCAECESDNLPGVKKAFETFDALCQKELEGEEKPRKACFVSNIYNKILPQMKSLGKDNRFGPGDRLLLVGESQNGNLLAGANRGFQTVAPVAKDSLTIELTKTDGGNGALVRICTVEDDGKTIKRVGTINFAEKNENGTQKAIITGIQGKVVRVDIASFGSAVKKFKYTLVTN